MTRHSRPPARARGYSLVEVMIASALIGALLLGAARWTMTLVELTAQHADLTRPRVTAMFLADQLRADLDAAVVCEPTGTGAVLHAIDADMLTIYTPAAGTAVQAVQWSYSATAGTVSRSVIANTGNCTFPTPGTPDAVLATGVNRVGNQPAFTSIGGDVPGYRGSCAPPLQRSCSFTAIRAQLAPTSPATGATGLLDITVRLYDRRSSL
jgi:prepilin-type N-terminal cleavage/methylation domain-containing protein